MYEYVDLGEYPESHMYMFYTNSENVPKPIHEALDAMSNCQGLKVSDMMFKTSKSLDKATAGSQHNPVDLDDCDPMLIDSNDGKSIFTFSRRYEHITLLISSDRAGRIR